MKKRWKTLRNTFRIENSKMKLPSGSAAKKDTNWKYFQSMMFLNEEYSQTNMYVKLYYGNLENYIAFYRVVESFPTGLSALSVEILDEELDTEESSLLFSPLSSSNDCSSSTTTNTSRKKKCRCF